ncbi:hypothetical protein [Actinokineospora iranica]|uniref:Uncharacterized protein n=1 Tax=Actinokineospora iranica TaxID=1271860 RepID=A0A1G6VS28_9PSEU|nr:hypothetical protein [Actinokineospora iranica]SDD56359.1 hypothetical protein SAMN05216174_11364 [Actinokineospora iranica]
MKALGLSALIAAVVLAAAAAPAAGADASAGASQVPTMRWVSEQEYIALVGAEEAANPHFSPAPAGARMESAPLDPPQHWYDINQIDTDPRGFRIPTRHGTPGPTGWGYEHYADNHNLYSFKALTAAYRSKPAVDQGAHAEYNGYLVSGNVTIAQIHTVAQLANRTEDGSHVTFDGKYIGTITAFCVGVNRCPNAVNANG